MDHKVTTKIDMVDNSVENLGIRIHFSVNNFIYGMENTTIALCKKNRNHSCNTKNKREFYKFQLNYTDASKYLDIPMGR